MGNKTTNVQPNDLNYGHYSENKYDRDIVNSIPFHKELHQKIAQYIQKNFKSTQKYEVLDLGVGTGITSKLIQDVLPESHLTVVDFSEQMMKGAKRKLGNKNVTYLLGDYASLSLKKNMYDAIVSVVGIHHQTDLGKKKLFNKIYSLLKPGGVFIFGDLVTYKDQYAKAYNHALHYHHLVEHATDKKTLREWSHHHMFLNLLAPVEDQINWLEEVGFKVKTELLKMNTALLVCKK